MVSPRSISNYALSGSLDKLNSTLDVDKIYARLSSADEYHTSLRPAIGATGGLVPLTASGSKHAQHCSRQGLRCL